MDNTLEALAERAGVSVDEYVKRRNRGLKFCRLCRDWHPRSAFGRNSPLKDGLRVECRQSRNAAARKPPLPNLRPFPDRHWRPVPGYERSYEVSDKGAVWSLPRGGKPGRLLKQHLDRRRKYLNVALVRGGTQRTINVHLLVMRAFVGPCPLGLETRHLDGNSTNNSWPDNLVYGTPEENLSDKFRHGTTGRGEGNPRHKLTSDSVLEIHRCWNGGESKRSLSRRFGVAPPMIRRILSGSAWQDEYDRFCREFPLGFAAAPA
jgi:hypothetical protein